MNSLPQPSPEAQQRSEQLTALIRTEINAADGWIDFARFMHLVLYTPELGYYSGGARKFGQDGDFVTAPEISPLFAQTLARQAMQILRATNGDILELGAGTGRLAAVLLLELEAAQQLPTRYYILDVSAHLREVQRETLQHELSPDLMRRVEWLDSLPDEINGLVLANEVLDALPVHVVHMSEEGPCECGVVWDTTGFVWENRPVSDARLLEQVTKLNLPLGYTSELCLAATGLMASLAERLQQGAMLFIDYGFSRREYYHPQRNQGTLMCHYQHHAHSDPFWYPGLQDITAHVDFTTLAEAGVAHGLQLKGYTTQAQFLINCGITDLLTQASPSDVAFYAPLAAQAQKLLSPAEMGELFKVIAFAKNMPEALPGFARGDKQHTL